jgi:hypothetical protein
MIYSTLHRKLKTEQHESYLEKVEDTKGVNRRKTGISFLLADFHQLIASGYIFGFFRLVLLVIDIDHIGPCKSNKRLKGWLRDVIPCF